MATALSTELLLLTAPKSVSSPQMATTTSFGTPNCCSMRAKVAAFLASWLLRALDARRDHAAGEFLEALLEDILVAVEA